MNKVLVTGGTGFIGQHVVARLKDGGYTPVVFDRHVRKISDTELILGDVRDEVQVTEAIAHVDGVIHLAGVLGTQETIANPLPAAQTNVIGGLNVFEAVAQYRLPCVYIAVGNWWEQNTYSISKTTVERFAEMFTAYRNAPISIVRALNAYGPGQAAAAPFGPSKVRKITPSFVCRALSGQPIEIYGDGTQVMDMIHVSDVADVLVRALEVGPSPRIYEAGTGRETTVAQIAKAVVAATGSDSGLCYLPMRRGESAALPVVGDPNTLGPLYGERPELTSFEDGIGETVDWFRANRGVTWDS